MLGHKKWQAAAQPANGTKTTIMIKPHTHTPIKTKTNKAPGTQSLL